MAFEEVAEAVTDGDLRNLAYPLQVADAGEQTLVSHRSWGHYAPPRTSGRSRLVGRRALVGRPRVVSHGSRRTGRLRSLQQGDAMLELAHPQFQVLNLAPGGYAKVAQRALK